MIINWINVIKIYSRVKGVTVCKTHDVFFEDSKGNKIYYSFAKKIAVTYPKHDSVRYKYLRCVPSGKGDSLWHIFSSTNKFIVVHKKVVIEQPKNKPNYGQISR